MNYFVVVDDSSICFSFQFYHCAPSGFLLRVVQKCFVFGKKYIYIAYSLQYHTTTIATSDSVSCNVSSCIS